MVLVLLEGKYRMGSGKIMVSIICAAYNHELFIAQALESFITQETDYKFEVIINDDASTDRTAEIIREYENKYPDIVKAIYQTENQYSKGVSISELLVSNSKGKYIANCEGDDFWIDKRKLQKQVDYMESHPDCSMCGHANIIVNQNGEYLRNRCDCMPNSIVNLINDGGYMHYATRLSRREVFTSFPKILAKKFYGGVADIYYAHTLGYLYFFGAAMSAWRINENSVTHSLYLGPERKKEIVYDYIKFFERFDNYTKKKYHKGLQKRSAEQLIDMISSIRKELGKEDFKTIVHSMGFSNLNWKYKIYSLVRCFV